MIRNPGTRRSSHIGLALWAVLLLPTNALAMRCGNQLIDKGDTQAKVLRYCGEPVQAQQRLGIRSGVYRNSGTRFGGSPKTDLSFSRGYYLPYGRREVVVEEWVFNFGPNKFMRRVTFEDGIVEKVEELDYGYRD